MTVLRDADPADKAETYGNLATLLREMEEELFGREDTDNTVHSPNAADPMHPTRLTEQMRWLLDNPGSLRIECTWLRAEPGQRELRVREPDWTKAATTRVGSRSPAFDGLVQLTRGFAGP